VGDSSRRSGKTSNASKINNASRISSGNAPNLKRKARLRNARLRHKPRGKRARLHSKKKIGRGRRMKSAMRIASNS